MEICQSDALLVKSVQMGRPQNRVTMTGEIALALVIGQDDDHIWPRSFRAGEPVGMNERCQQRQGGKKTAELHHSLSKSPQKGILAEGFHVTSLLAC